MDYLKYDLHVHTKASCCSNLDYSLILKLAKKAGLNGIAITDHNTIKGAKEVKKNNPSSDFEVIIGSEIKTTDMGEILAYYLNDEIYPGTCEEVIEKVREQGGLVSCAHPRDIFRAHFSEKELKKINIDALEVFNGRSLLPSFNNGAKEISKIRSLSQLGGSDAHFSFELGKCFTEFKDDLRLAIKTKKTIAKGSTYHAPIGYFCTILRKQLRLG
jgi:predicted metal-dependent phosphoesterase TrpH